jgi:hypothetical protein
MSEINWNAELRKVSREYDGLAAEPTAEEIRAKRLAEEAAQKRNADAAAAAGVWIRLFLVSSLAAGLNFWPYPRECGPGLIGYVIAQAVFTAGAIWVAFCTWRCRMGKTHLLALGMMLAGIAALEIQILPRTGYAKVDASHPPQWGCVELVPGTVRATP